MSVREDGFTKPCREYPQCRHYKHGYTRKDRPAPHGLRTKPARKSDEDIKRIADDYVAVRYAKP